jgi:disulfide bond formation protein DsbB
MNKEIILSSPPVAVAGASVLGFSLPEWAALVTIIYTLLLVARFLRNEWREWKKWWKWRE